MSNETEKLTINLSVVELAQIDVLVEQGIFSNRSDFIRNSIRKQLETYSDKIEYQLEPVPSKDTVVKTVGIFSLSKKALEKVAQDKEKLSISVIGMLVVDSNVNAALFEQTVDNVLLRGKLIAPDEIKRIIEQMN